MVGRFSLVVAGWLVMAGAGMPNGGAASATSLLPHRGIIRASAFHRLEPAQRGAPPI